MQQTVDSAVSEVQQLLRQRGYIGIAKWLPIALIMIGCMLYISYHVGKISAQMTRTQQDVSTMQTTMTTMQTTMVTMQGSIAVLEHEVENHTILLRDIDKRVSNNETKLEILTEGIIQNPPNKTP